MSIAENLQRVQQDIADAAAKAGRPADEISLVAVSKTWPIEVIQEAVDAGHRVFGENKVQELEQKVPAMADNLQWHAIGHLQKNKVRKVLPLCTMIHSIDSIALAERIDRIAGEDGLKIEGLLQVNVAEDDAKFGLAAEEAKIAIEKLARSQQSKSARSHDRSRLRSRAGERSSAFCQFAQATRQARG